MDAERVASSLRDDLLVVLRAVTGRADLEYAMPPSPLHGGFWAELVAFRLATAPPGWPVDLVARMMPDAALAAKETAFQAVVATQGFPTPVVRAFGGPGDGLGRAFLVMDRADGVPLLGGLSGVGAVVRLPRLATRVPDVLASAMAQLHRLDPGPLRARLSEGTASTDVPALLGVLSDRAGDLGRADLVTAGCWLATNPPPATPEVICHGDLHPFNVLRSKAGAITVLDWTAAVLGSGDYDVAFTSLLLAEPPLEAPAALRPLIGRAGHWLATRFLDRYRRYSGTSVDTGSLRWHTGLVCLRSLVEVAGWVGAGEVEQRAGHPWLVCGPSFARRLSSLTGAAVTPR